MNKFSKTINHRYGYVDKLSVQLAQTIHSKQVDEVINQQPKEQPKPIEQSKEEFVLDTSDFVDF